MKCFFTYMFALTLFVDLSGMSSDACSNKLSECALPVHRSVPSFANSLFLYPKRFSTIVTPMPTLIGLIRDSKNRPVKDSMVSVIVDGQLMGSATSNKDGVWSYRLTPNQALSDGCHSVMALDTKSSIFLKDTTFTVASSGLKSGNVSVAESFIAYPYDSAAINSATPTIVGFVNDADGNPVSDETIIGSVDDINPLYMVNSDSNGVWSYTLSSDQALADGSHVIGARASQTGVTLAPQLFTIDTVAPAAPTISTPHQNDTITSNTVTVVGITEPYATVTVFVNDDTAGQSTQADASGIWSVDLFLTNGSYSITAQAQDLAGNLSALSNAVSITVSVF